MNNNSLDSSLRIRTCANCHHGTMEISTGYWEFPDEYNIVCDYPNNGNLINDRKDPIVLERLGDWAEGDGDLQDEAEKCDDYTHYSGTN